MSVANDPDPRFSQYSHPQRLVSTEWLAAHIDDPGVVIAESDEDVLLYDTGHIPGAVKLDWHTDLNDPVARDYVDADAFGAHDFTDRPLPQHERVLVVASPGRRGQAPDPMRSR